MAAGAGCVCWSAVGLCAEGSDCQGFDRTVTCTAPGISKSIIKKQTLLTLIFLF